MSGTKDESLRRALTALGGLSVGDAFGEQFFGPPGIISHRIATRTLPNAPWRWTDDTQMALSIVSILRQRGEIDQEDLALSFGYRYDAVRGYAPAMHDLLPRLASGVSWSGAAPARFGGKGSFGNGGAMRVAPLGAYFAADLNAIVENARLATEVTHAHPEGIAGAIAVAVGAAIAWEQHAVGQRPSRTEFINLILPWVPQSIVRTGIETACDLPPATSVSGAASRLGNGSRVTAQDTVPFVLWCAGEYLDNYEEALWQTVSAGGDIDTTCAIVGGIVVTYTGHDGIPGEWLNAREPLPVWHLTANGP